MGDFGLQFHSAGRCLMYLLWLESRIKDFLCIRDAQKRNDADVVQEFNEMRRTGKPSMTYERHVFQWAKKSLGALIREFLDEWPEYKSDTEVSHAFKIMEIHRNAFSHAYMPTTGGRFLFVPSEKTRKLIRETGLPVGELTQANPHFALLLPCLHEPFVVSFYENIKRIDYGCFWKVAKQLEISNYAGILADPNWPLTEGVNPVTLGPTAKPPERGEQL